MLGTPYRLFGLFVLVGACAKTPEPPPPAPPTAASVAINAPAEGGTTGSRIVVRLAASGVRVVAASGTRVAGEGHHHLFLDADPGPPETVIGTGGGIFHLGSGVDSLVLDSLAPGPHRLIAVFASGDHVPMAEVRADTVQFEVKQP
jgi:hypothetical protein